MKSNGSQPAKDYFWLNLRDLPYFRALVRAVESSYYQDFDLTGPILDVGCGDGDFAKVTFDQPIDVGLDPWTGPIHRARGEGSYRALVQGDGGTMPFPDGYFGSAFSNSVLEHIPHVQAVLKDTARVLKPGALFVFCVPNPRYLTELSIAGILNKLGLKSATQAYTEWFRVMSRVQHAEPPEVWRGWLESAGFTLEKHWDYFSPGAMHALEWGHFFGAPTLAARALFGHWIIAPYHWNLFLTDALIRPYAGTDAHPQGTFTFFVARKKV